MLLSCFLCILFVFHNIGSIEILQNYNLPLGILLFHSNHGDSTSTSEVGVRSNGSEEHGSPSSLAAKKDVVVLYTGLRLQKARSEMEEARNVFHPLKTSWSNVQPSILENAATLQLLIGLVESIIEMNKKALETSKPESPVGVVHFMSHPLEFIEDCNAMLPKYGKLELEKMKKKILTLSDVILTPEKNEQFEFVLKAKRLLDKVRSYMLSSSSSKKACGAMYLLLFLAIDQLGSRKAVLFHATYPVSTYFTSPADQLEQWSSLLDAKYLDTFLFMQLNVIADQIGYSVDPLILSVVEALDRSVLPASEGEKVFHTCHETLRKCCILWTTEVADLQKKVGLVNNINLHRFMSFGKANNRAHEFQQSEVPEKINRSSLAYLTSLSESIKTLNTQRKKWLCLPNLYLIGAQKGATGSAGFLLL